MKSYFLDIIKTLQATINNKEKFTAWFSAETLDFARFNQAKIRQAGTTVQQYLDLDLINGQRHANMTIGLSQNLTNDCQVIKSSIAKLRGHIEKSSPDPFLMINEGNTSSESIFDNELANKEETVDVILKECQGLDLVGCYFGGPIYKGFANSFGQINWFKKASFVLDTSIYHSNDKAIKQCYADTRFDKEVFKKKVADAKLGLKLFDKESVNLSPGSYRVYFSPTAVNEIISMINWGGFSKKALEVKNSPLMPLHNRVKTLSKDFSLWENIEAGIGPNFQAQGFLKKNHIPIIENGELKNTLISPKTAKEYQLDHNGADDNEAMCAIDMKAGSLADEDILSTLGDGLFINNLWYLNFSDRQNGCLTGMTRFFCYVVKGGKPIAPFSVMRFDDSIYRIFGENLCHITKNRELIIDNSTYDERSTSCAILPGVIAENVRFTL